MMSKCRGWSLFSSVLLLLCCTATFAAAGAADDLPRHGIIGLTVGAPHPEQPENPASNPPTVQSVAPGGAGERAGIRAGDILRALDGVPITSSIGFAQSISRHLAGDTIHLHLTHAGHEVERTAVLAPRPFETSPDAEVVYSSINVAGSHRRVIVTRPKTPGRHPAVLLIGGLGCYSLDGALMSDTSYGPILAALAKRNFATMRAEKTGEGDS